MSWISRHLWLIPLLPFAAAGVTALFPRAWRRASSAIALGAIAAAFALSVAALFRAMDPGFVAAGGREAFNFTWFTSGQVAVRLGLLLDPLSALMLVVVSLVSLLVFAFSVGYMAEDGNFTRFFCFLSLFAGSMLALVASNSLLLLFVAWELVGLSSYLLIGFWYHKPSAAAAMKKAFLVTRVGDLGFFVGLLWFYSGAGTSLFYDLGNGALEGARLDAFAGGAATAVALLVFCGAAGKSGQFPLHVWLPDAMEGPTPVSALIHAATMVAAGVFLVARMFPVFELSPTALHAVAMVGSFTALFAASVALAQWDIKRILAWSTVSQLGYMMLGLGVGGYVAGMFHLFTHAFFKALLFLGAGAVIHSCHHEQDIRRLGGLKDRMPLIFICYAVGALALAGLPPFAGFFSKDEILVAAWHYPEHFAHWSARLPFWAALAGAFLTAFYMTRQVRYAFYGAARGEGASHAHEAGRWMLVPVAILAALSVVAGFAGFPGKNRFHAFLLPSTNGHHGIDWSIALASTSLVILAIGLGWKVYGPAALAAGRADPLETLFPRLFALLHRKYGVDEIYAATLLRANRLVGAASSWFDRWILDGLAVGGVSALVRAASFVNHLLDEMVINRGFDKGCGTVQGAGALNRYLQGGLTQHYMRIAAAAIFLLTALLMLLVRRGGT